MPFVPHTGREVQLMLDEIGVTSIADLFDEIPPHLIRADLSTVGPGLTEMEVLQLLGERAHKDSLDLCFAGGGSYDHHIPAVVWDIASRGEFLTSYTPYQAEASQGTLQVIFEYQTMMCHLTGMDVSNASVYDGGSALAESILMAYRRNKWLQTQKVVVPMTVNPNYVKAAQTIVGGQGIQVEQIPTPDGFFDPSLADVRNPGVVVVQQPNYFGVLEKVDEITRWARGGGASVVAITNPQSLSLLKSPREWGSDGVDITCVDGQPLGIPMSSGGPSFGFICCRESFLRELPGRIVAETTDQDNQVGYTLALQAREQHIRRGKARSNICTNQGLLVTAATIYLSLMGSPGLRAAAQASYDATHSLVEMVTALPGVEQQYDAPFFHECVLHLDVNADALVAEMAEEGILAGIPLASPSSAQKNCLLVCATEKHTHDHLQRYVSCLDGALKRIRRD